MYLRRVTLHWKMKTNFERITAGKTFKPTKKAIYCCAQRLTFLRCKHALCYDCFDKHFMEKITGMSNNDKQEKRTRTSPAWKALHVLGYSRLRISQLHIITSFTLPVTRRSGSYIGHFTELLWRNYTSLIITSSNHWRHSQEWMKVQYGKPIWVLTHTGW